MAYSSQNNTIDLETALEEDRIGRSVLVWLNAYPDLPVDVINYEFLPANVPCMALSAIQGAYIINRNIIGGYEAEYPFKLIYRVKSGNSIDKRLQADEFLNQIGEWVRTQTPDLGKNIIVQSIERTTRSSIFARYENGEEDHQIFLKLTYKVSPFPF